MRRNVTINSLVQPHKLETQDMIEAAKKNYKSFDGVKKNLTPKEKYKVSPKLEKYTKENGSRSFEMRCLK